LTYKRPLNRQAQKVKNLNSIVGQKQIKIDYLEKMIDVAKDEFDTKTTQHFTINWFRENRC